LHTATVQGGVGIAEQFALHAPVSPPPVPLVVLSVVLASGGSEP
jgi:hypothetical protein